MRRSGGWIAIPNPIHSNCEHLGTVVALMARAIVHLAAIAAVFEEQRSSTVIVHIDKQQRSISKAHHHTGKIDTSR